MPFLRAKIHKITDLEVERAPKGHLVQIPCFINEHTEARKRKHPVPR